MILRWRCDECGGPVPCFLEMWVGEETPIRETARMACPNRCFRRYVTWMLVSKRPE